MKHAKRKATVSFTGSDDKTAKSAKSALKFKCTLKPGRHTVRTCAVDSAANSSTAAVRTFRVRR